MSGARVFNIKRDGVPPGAVYIGRFNPTYGVEESKWANPFQLRRNATAEERVEVIAKYEAWLRSQPDLMAALPELRGKDLVCWCKPLACHGDLLVRLAEESA